jgi:hypothetical protein
LVEGLYPGQENDDEVERRLHRKVLAFVLVEHPVPTTIADVRRELELGGGVPIESAVAVLVEDGLLARQGDEVMPTAAALRFHRIEPMEPPDLDG